MIPYSEDLELALLQERDISEIAELDTGLIENARNTIRELPEDSPERGCLIDYLTDLVETRIWKIMRLVHRNQPIDTECAQAEEIQLYDTIRESREECARKLGIDLNRGGEEE